MPQCDSCGKEVLLPFECKFCGRKICIEHRLPENHSCPHTPPKTPLGRWEAKIRAPHELTKERKRSEPPIIAEKDYCPNCRSYRKQAITYDGKKIFEARILSRGHLLLQGEFFNERSERKVSACKEELSIFGPLCL